MLNEYSLRRSDFGQGPPTTPVVLADGQEWHLPRPTFVFVPDEGEAGARHVSSLGPDYQALIDAHEAAIDTQDFRKVVGAQVRLFAFLVRASYDVTTEQLGELVRVSYEEGSEGHALLERLRELAYGRVEAPKASTAGQS